MSAQIFITSLFIHLKVCSVFISCNLTSPLRCLARMHTYNTKYLCIYGCVRVGAYVHVCTPVWPTISTSHVLRCTTGSSYSLSLAKLLLWLFVVLLVHLGSNNDNKGNNEVLSIFVCHLSRPSTCTLSSALACHRHNYQENANACKQTQMRMCLPCLSMRVCMYMCETYLCTCIHLYATFPHIYSVAVENNVCNSVCISHIHMRVCVRVFVLDWLGSGQKLIHRPAAVCS